MVLNNFSICLYTAVYQFFDKTNLFRIVLIAWLYRMRAGGRHQPSGRLYHKGLGQFRAQRKAAGIGIDTILGNRLWRQTGSSVDAKADRDPRLGSSFLRHKHHPTEACRDARTYKDLN